MKSTLSAISEGISIGIASMALAFSVAAFLNVLLEPPQHDTAARQELQGLMDPETYRVAIDYFLEEIQ